MNVVQGLNSFSDTVIIGLFNGKQTCLVYFVTDACLRWLCLFQFFSNKPRDYLFFVEWDVKPQLS